VELEATYEKGEGGTEVVVRGDARQRLYDASGFGEPLDGDTVRLTLVEAAYLLREDKLPGVDGDGYDEVARRLDGDAGLRVYTDLRERGYYLDDGDRLRYYERGDHPANSSPVGTVGVFGEDGELSLPTDHELVAVADDDGDVTYFDVSTAEPSGDHPSLDGADVQVRETGGGFVVEDGIDALRDGGYGSERDDALHISDAEAAYLRSRGKIDTPSTDADDATTAVYADLRERGTRPRTGFKFGAEFRVYETTDDEHAPYLVSVREGDESVGVVDVSRAVRLAHGVRKTMLFALVDDGDVEYVSVEREKP